MEAAFEARLVVDGIAVDRSDVRLLRAVEREGSLSAAADALDRSYSHAHDRVSDLEDALGPLLDRQRGGPDGGGSTLTDTARDLLARFDRLRAALAGTARTEEVAIEGAVRERDGELARVATDAGEFRAVCYEDADRVDVVLSADAITLHRLDTAPPATDTSARNRLRGAVSDVEAGESIATVTVAAEGVAVPVVVTKASLDLLDIAVGTSVVATFKAAATHAVPR
ncbi:TOBE domain-containing protein [Halococcoides cellulosivorans]|uniref:Molybdenum-binding protein n=1 Tax=Halococcoides cellulosivorans TaxID=1679096 RepID=A0A2R4X0S8_9EURY|nr:TOBE domain-containing protein [Halococcoides cellulosivorans]AWB27398.1 molybdenum-binding protein [Halococcoides cellulosivorans]